MTMKKSTIWILGIVMGLSFLSLLYLQISYIEKMVKMRNEQFDESVKRGLMAASKEVESAEVARWLREDISEAESTLSRTLAPPMAAVLPIAALPI